MSVLLLLPSSSMSTDEMSFLEYVALMALPFMKPLCGRNQAYKSVKNRIFVRTLMALKLHASIEVFRILKDGFLKRKIKEKSTHVRLIPLQSFFGGKKFKHELLDCTYKQKGALKKSYYWFFITMKCISYIVWYCIVF